MTKPVNFNPELARLIREHYRELGAWELAKRTGYAPSYVRQVASWLGLTRQRGGPRQNADWTVEFQHQMAKQIREQNYRQMRGNA